MNTVSIAKAALLGNFSGATDKKGYTRLPQENLVSGIDLATVEDDLRGGDGDELRIKFCAVHSSCALAVNCFAPFKANPTRLHLLGRQGATNVQFEKKLPIFDKGGCPNLDVWIEREDAIVAVESKLLEYLTPKTPEFSPTYEALAPPKTDPCWWGVYEEAKKGRALGSRTVDQTLFRVERISAPPSRTCQTDIALSLLGAAELERTWRVQETQG